MSGWRPLRDEDVMALGAGAPLVIDGALGPAAVEVAQALSAFAGGGALRPAAVGRRGDRGFDPKLRGDHMAWLDEVDPRRGLEPLWALFEAVRAEVNQAAWLGLRRFEVQVACYPGGGARYRAHRDAFRGDRNRVLTAIWYANVDWTPAAGGALRVTLPDGAQRDISPVLDRLVVFRSELLLHEVLPVEAPRVAATAWYRANEGPLV